MGLASAWVLFPVVLIVVATGWGLMVELAAGKRLPGATLPGLGLAAIAAVLSLSSSIVPELGLPIVLAASTAGVGLCASGVGPRGSLSSLRPCAEQAAVALGAFAVFALPVVLSGAAVLSGYLRLDDSTTFLALGDWVFQHGRSTAGLPPSSYETSLTLYLASGYPVGSMLPLVSVGRLVGSDLVFLWMPFMAVLAAVLALAIESIMRPLSPDPRVRVPAAVLAAASTLLFGYALWGGIKEVWTAALAALVAALVPWTIRALDAASPVVIARGLLPMLVATGGIVSGLSVAGAVWAMPAFAVLAAGASIERGRARLVPWVVLGSLVTVVALLPLVRQVPFVRGLTLAPTSGPEWLGNLLEPLSTFQLLGVWPAEDFRVDPVAMAPTILLLGAICIGTAWALARAPKARDWGLLAYGGVLLSAAAVLALSDWAWAEAKTLAIASPVPLALSGAAAGHLLTSRTGLRPLGAVLLAALVVGVVWSDALAFRGTTLSPRDRHEELVTLNERFGGRGPTLFPEYDPYATRWLLRDLDPEGAGALRRRQIPLTDGSLVQKGETADIDSFALAGLAPYRMIVVRRSPLASRPSSAFRRVWRGRWYEAWERVDSRRPVIERLGLGTAVDPGAVPACADVRRLARRVGAGGALIAATAQAPVLGGLDPSGAPASWSVAASGSLTPDDAGEGVARTSVTAPVGARYEVWVGGAFRGDATVSVDGREIGHERHQLSYTGQLVPFGAVSLTPGQHTVSIELHNRLLRPGTNGINRFPIGPVALVAADAPLPLIRVPALSAEALCGQKLDWVEAVR